MGDLDAGPLRYRNDPSMFLNYGVTNINLSVASFHDFAVPTRKWHDLLWNHAAEGIMLSF